MIMERTFNLYLKMMGREIKKITISNVKKNKINFQTQIIEIL